MMPRGLRMVGPAMRRAPLAIAAALLGACASQSSISHLYVHPTIQPSSARHVYVTCRGGEATHCRDIETGVAAELRRAGVRVTTRRNSEISMTTTDRPEFENALRALGVDKVLVVRVGRIERTLDRVEGRTEVKANPRRGDPYDLFLSDYEDLTEPDSYQLGQTLVLVSSLHLADGGTQVWAVQTSAEHRESLTEAISAQADAIVNSLRNDRWLR